MIKKLIIFIGILCALIVGLLGVYFFKPDLLRAFTPEILKAAPKGIPVGKMNVPVIVEGKVYKYIYMDIRILPSNSEDNNRIIRNISRYRDIITRDVYLFIASRPPQIPIQEDQILRRLDALMEKSSDTKEPVKLVVAEFVEKDSQGTAYLQKLDESKERTKKSLEVKQAENFLDKANVIKKQAAEEKAPKKATE